MVRRTLRRTDSIPWNVGSVIGYLAGGAVDTHRLGLDIAFPDVMAGLSLGMVSGRRDVGLVAGALFGPFFGLAVPASPTEESSNPETTEPSAEAGLP
jgi:predicted branched-subunit amino acid permease